MSSSPLQPPTSTPSLVVVTVTTTTCAVGLVTYMCWHRCRRPRRFQARQPPVIRNNSSAKGSDVVTIYKDNISKNDIYIITGATSGLGREMARLLGRAGANLLLAVRNASQGECVQQEIENSCHNNNSNNNTIQVWELDLSSFGSVRAFVKKFQDTYGDASRIVAGLLNNAGVYGVEGVTTSDGFQTTWQTNVLGPALLTELLLPNMTDTARIIHVSSELHKMVWHISANCPPTTSGTSTYDYALSKACQVLHAHELTLRFQQEELTKNNFRRRAMAVDPGLVHTKIARHASKFQQWIHYKVLRMILRTTDQGCATALYCLLAPEQELGKDDQHSYTNSYYYANCAPQRTTRCCASLTEVSAQKELFEKLWKMSKHHSVLSDGVVSTT